MNQYIIRLLLATTALTVVLFMISLTKSGSRPTSLLTNLQGISYPIVDGQAQIYESMAHTDIALQEPVLGKEALVDITFIPHDTKFLALGIRRSGFWLSYELEPLHSGETGTTITTTITTQVRVPLTDKFQDRDRSIDLMFFAADNATTDPATFIGNTASWELVDLKITTVNAKPSILQLANYAVSIALRERAL